MLKLSFLQLTVHAESAGGDAEDPMEIIIIVIDQNDNKPVFNQSIYTGEVPEASGKSKVPGFRY